MPTNISPNAGPEGQKRIESREKILRSGAVRFSPFLKNAIACKRACPPRGASNVMCRNATHASTTRRVHDSSNKDLNDKPLLFPI